MGSFPRLWQQRRCYRLEKDCQMTFLHVGKYHYGYGHSYRGPYGSQIHRVLPQSLLQSLAFPPYRPFHPFLPCLPYLLFPPTLLVLLPFLLRKIPPSPSQILHLQIPSFLQAFVLLYSQIHPCLLAMLYLPHQNHHQIIPYPCSSIKQYSLWIQMQSQHRKFIGKLILLIIVSLFIEHYRQFYFKMQTTKRSMDQISLELTEKYIELDSRKYIPSELKLEYSKTQISIQEIPLQPQSPLLENHSYHPNSQIDKLPKIAPKHLDYTQNLYNIESPQCWQKSRLKLYQPHHPRTDRLKDPKQREATSLIAKLPRYIKPQKMKSKSLGLKNSFPPKNGHEKENQIAYKLLKFKLEEEKRKYQSFRVTTRGSEIKKGHLVDNQIAHRGIDQNNNFLARKIKLDYNEAQEKKYLQRLIMNRQSILHISQRLMQLPAIKQQ